MVSVALVATSCCRLRMRSASFSLSKVYGVSTYSRSQEGISTQGVEVQGVEVQGVEVSHKSVHHTF